MIRSRQARDRVSRVCSRLFKGLSRRTGIIGTQTKVHTLLKDTRRLGVRVYYLHKNNESKRHKTLTLFSFDSNNIKISLSYDTDGYKRFLMASF
jgi:hypothetical protein